MTPKEKWFPNPFLAEKYIRVFVNFSNILNINRMVNDAEKTSN
jgi:hypothetical protein